MDIVQNIQRANQTLVTTGDYQSPNGGGAIIQGIAQGVSRGFSEAGRGGGRQTDFAGLHAYMSQMRDIYNSKQMSDSEARSFQKQVYDRAYKDFGADPSDVNNIAAQTGFTFIQERAQEQMKRDKFVKAREDTNVYNVGLEQLGPNAPLDSIMSTGAATLAASEAAVEAAKRFGALTPQQQQEALKTSSLPGYVSKSIQEGWKSHYSRSEFNDVPEESALMSYRSMKERELARGFNISPVAAKAIVDRAMLPYELTLYGDKALEDHGLQYYRDAAVKAYQTDREIRSEDILEQFMNREWKKKVPTSVAKEGYVMVKGDVLMADLTSNGSIESTGAASKILSILNATDLIQDLASNLKSRYSYNHMRLLFSQDGADLATILADNPQGEKNINEGRGQALKEAIAESAAQTDDERKASKSYFVPQKQFNKSFKLSNGESMSQDTFAAMKESEDPAVTNKEVDDVLKSIAVESNAATENNGFYFLTKDGALKYYGMVGQRLKNLANIPYNLMTLGNFDPAERLEDLTDAGRLVESGDMDAVIMRENIPDIQETLRVIKEYYKIGSEELRQRFNRAQIMNTDGGKRARSLQILEEEGALRDAFFDSSFTFTMNTRDADKVIEAIDEGKVPEAIAVSEETATAAKDVGRTLEGVVSLAAVPGMIAGEQIASRSGEATRARVERLEAERAGGDVVSIPVSRITSPDAERYMEWAFGERAWNNIKKDAEGLVNADTTKGIVSALANGKTYTSFREPAFDVVEAIAKEALTTPVSSSTTVTKNSDGTFSRVSEDGKKIGKYKTRAEAFRASTESEVFTDKSQKEPGNIDLTSRAIVRNEDGSISTEYSIIIGEDNEYVLIPTVVNGRVVSEDEAVEHYHQTGEHHGKYRSIEDAEKASRKLSEIQRKRYMK